MVAAHGENAEKTETANATDAADQRQRATGQKKSQKTPRPTSLPGIVT